MPHEMRKPPIRTAFGVGFASAAVRPPRTFATLFIPRKQGRMMVHLGSFGRIMVHQGASGCIRPHSSTAASAESAYMRAVRSSTLLAAAVTSHVHAMR